MRKRWQRPRSIKMSLTLLIIVILLFSSACSSQGATKSTSREDDKNTKSSKATPASNTSPESNDLPIANGDVTLKIYIGFGGAAKQYLKSLNDHTVVQQISRETGMKFEFIHPPDGDDGTFFNTTIASGQYPDLFYGSNFNNYPGGVEGAIDDGILLDIDDLVAQYAPNFLSLVEERGGETDKWIRGDGGSIIKFGTMFLPPFVDERVHNGLIIRKDLLKKFGLEAPETLDEYTQVLRAFKENGIEVPLALATFDDYSVGQVNAIASAFGVAINDFQLEDNGNKVIYSRTDPRYKEFLTFLKGWADEKLIDRDLVGRSVADTNTLFFNGRAGATFAHNTAVKTALSVGREDNPDFDVLGLVYPRKNKGEELHLSRQALSVNTNAWYVSATSEHPVEAIKLIDYLHKEETRLLTAWGVGTEETPTFEIDENGSRKFTDLLNNNPDMDFNSARAVYTLGAFQVMYDDEMERQQYNLPQNLQVWEAWATRNDNKQKLPHVLTLSVEEAKEVTGILTKINNYADELVYKFIFGEVSLEEFDNFTENIRKLGSERAEEIYLQAYKRFQSR